MITFVRNTSLFATNCAALVNPVNCTGVMGAGLAKQFRERFPENYKFYRQLYLQKQLKPGCVYRYSDRDLESNKDYVIMNMTTKDHWKDDSSYKFIERGLIDLKIILDCFPYIDIALPKLGCGFGRLNWNFVRTIIIDQLSQCHNTIIVCE